MKRNISLLLTAALAVSLTACGLSGRKTAAVPDAAAGREITDMSGENNREDTEGLQTMRRIQRSLPPQVQIY